MLGVMKGQKSLIEFSIVPVGSGEHLSDHVAKCTRLVRESGIKNELHAMGTILEGDLDECFELIKKCLDEVRKDSPRVSAAIRVDIRSGNGGGIEKSVESVEGKL